MFVSFGLFRQRLIVFLIIAVTLFLPLRPLKQLGTLQRYVKNPFPPPSTTTATTTATSKATSMKQAPSAPLDPSTERLSFFPPPLDPCRVNDTSPSFLVPDHHEAFTVLQRVHRGVSRAQGRRNRNPHSRRILCMVYSYEPNHATLLRAIVSTWGRHCDGFYAASNATDPTLGAYNLPKQGPEAYSNMWQKVREMWKLVYDYFLHEYDYFLICGDDTYVVVENLRDYLVSEQVKRLERGYRDLFAERADPQGKWRHVVDRPIILAQPVAMRGLVRVHAFLATVCLSFCLKLHWALTYFQPFFHPAQLQQRARSDLSRRRPWLHLKPSRR